MFKLRKYLKPYLIPLFASIVFLFIQAMCELNLPNYMSNIVNIGIQQNGIEHASPSAISENAYHFMKFFMEPSERDLLDEQYTLIQQNDPQYIKDYPLLETENIYILKETDEDIRTDLDGIFGKTCWTFINMMQDVFSEEGETFTLDSADTESVNFNELYQLKPMLEQMPASIIEDARERASEVQETIQLQTGTTMVQMFYSELGVDVDTMQMNYILSTGAIMLLISLIGIVSAIIVGFLSARIAAGVSKDIRKGIFSKVESYSYIEFDKFSTSSLITRTTNDVTQIQMLLVMGIRLIFFAPIMGVGGIIMILQKNRSMTWIIALAVVILIGIIGTIFSIAMPKFKITQKLIDKLNLVSRENLTGIMVVRAFGNQKFEEERFDKANQDLNNTNLFINRIMIFMMPVMMLIMNLVTVLIVWVGSHQVADSVMQVGDMMAFIQYSMQVIISFLMISIMFIMVPRASVSAERIAEVLETEPSIRDPKEAVNFNDNKKGVVEFKNVSFRYHGAEENVLHNISFIAKPGEITAFIGSTGSGKSTLINLIPRFYDVSEGEVLVNGVDVRSVSQHDLHKQIGYVPQKGVLLSGTIKSNLKYGNRDASDEEMITAAKVAQAEDFISQKEEQYDSSISEGGVNVSGGQKQRLSIARALVTGAPIYIFDDSFSALDFKTDAMLRKALKEQISDSTVLIVAQRVSTIMNAEQIIVLNEGKIVGKGTHKDLLENCPTYYEIASSQLAKEEL